MTDTLKTLVHQFPQAAEKSLLKLKIKQNLDLFVVGGHFDPTDEGEDLIIQYLAEIDKTFITEAINGDKDFEEAEEAMLKFIVVGVYKLDMRELLVVGDLYHIYRQKFVEHAIALLETHGLDAESEQMYKERQKEIWESSFEKSDF